MDLRRRRALWLLGALALLTAGPLLAAGPAVGAAGWRWPLDPPVAVVAGFVAPAGPFAPGHRGVDIGARVGDPVRSAAAGVVAFAGVVAGRGVVSVDHPGGLRTSYEPVTATVARGDQVGSGAVLGRLASVASHCPPAACLHWGLRRGETYLDPRSMLGAVRVRLLPVWGSAMPAAMPAVGAEPLGSARRPAPANEGGDSGSGAARLAVGAAAAVVGTAGVLLGRRRAHAPASSK
jgi:murein DD-endopeptidase MepM/ murein hydrolase activator NlpD